MWSDNKTCYNQEVNINIFHFPRKIYAIRLLRYLKPKFFYYFRYF